MKAADVASRARARIPALRLASVHREADGQVLCVFHVRRFHPQTLRWLFSLLWLYLVTERRYAQLSTWATLWIVAASFFRGAPTTRTAAI